MKALLVDDSDDVRLLTERELRRRGHEVLACADAEAAWTEYQRERWPLVLLDWLLPGMDGLELCRRMRALPNGDSSVILVITGQDRSEDLVAVLDAGASDYLPKPFTLGVLNVRLAIAERQVAEIAARKRAEAALERLATTDMLTGVANRRRATEDLERLTHLADRREEPLALALLDLDHFKQVNDRHGHAAGDEVLQRFGALLGESFRVEDVVGRWGGEEFVVAMLGASKRRLSCRLNTVCQQLCGESFASEAGGLFQATFSAGVAELPVDGKDLSTLYRAADAALYQAKEAGRNQVLCVA